MTAPRVAPIQPAAVRNIMDEWTDRYADDWVLFVREVHAIEPDPEQAEVLMDACRGERRMSIRSGHGFGKTATLAWIIECALLFRFPLRCVATAPISGTGSQLIVHDPTGKIIASDTFVAKPAFTASNEFRRRKRWVASILQRRLWLSCLSAK